MIINVFVVTIGKYHYRSKTSLDDYVYSVSNVNENIYASRGSIYEAGGSVVAKDIQTYDIICYLDSSRLSSGNEVAYVDDPSYVANCLAPILEMDAIDIYDILTSNSNLYQVELGTNGRNLSEAQVNQIKAIPNLHGIDFRNSYMRYYPYGESFSPQIVGFAKSDDNGKLVGQLGIESYFNDELSGTDGVHSYQQDKNGYILPGMFDYTYDAVDGYDIYLTLDAPIQEALNTCLEDTMKYKNASRAWGAVVEINTGKILAWSQTPTYDPNNIKSDDTQVNFGAQLAYEPGSVMKAVIYAAAMDMGVYDGEETFNSAPYCYTSDASRTYSGNELGCIYNVSKLNWGTIPLDYGLIYSSNVATATLLSSYVGVNNYKDYLDKFHLYQNVYTDGIDEIPGYTNYGLSPVDDITASYGQGSSLTMLQLLQAYTAIFGNGEMLKPYIVDKIYDPNTDSIIYKGERTVVSTPISKSAAQQMQDLLRRVVSDPEGTCRHYEANTVNVMGKTGTAEIAIDGSYSKDDNIVSCMLGFPYEDPKYMVYYAYISPETVYYNYDKKPIPDLIDRIALLEEINIVSDENEITDNTYKYEMPNLLSMSIDEAFNNISNISQNIYVIGDGNIIMRQYPKALDDVYKNEKIFLYTSKNNIVVPDFTNWTRKEIINYWNVSKIPISINGFGLAYEQSIKPNEIINNKTEIEIKLKDPNIFVDEKVEEKQD